MPYVEAVGRELELRLPEISETPGISRISGMPGNSAQYQPATLYLGGGTPSLLSSEALRLLFDSVCRHVVLTPSAEMTIEANPDDVTPEWIASLKDTPINRISMGVQSFNDAILRTLRRRHTAEQASKAVHLLHEAGYHNISLDLIYGLPDQTLDDFTHDVRLALSLGITHLSAYALQYEQGTQLYMLRQQGTIQEADEEMSLNCYEHLIDLTAQAGMEHYEISNFAQPGYRSRHNSSYWTNQPYIGLGAGAHSYSPSTCVRSFNCENIQEYIHCINEGRCPSTIETLSPIDRYNECVMLRLRTCEGLSLQDIEHQFGTERLNYLLRMAAPHLQRGTLQKKTDETLCLTRRGLFVSDDIISDLLLA